MNKALKLEMIVFFISEPKGQKYGLNYNLKVSCILTYE